MREYAGYSTADESNQGDRYLLSQGSTGLSIAFDLATQIGLDSDHPLCQGEVGKVGVAVNTLADLETLFDAIPLDQVSRRHIASVRLALSKEELRVLLESHPMSPETFERLQGLRRKVYDGHNYQERIRSFLEKRKPKFTGD